MIKVLCIGSVTRDIFLPTKEGIILETPQDLLSQRKIAFELGAKYHISNRYETLGGCPINVAAGLVKLGESVQCYAPIGADLTGKWIKENLHQLGIDTKHLVVINDQLSDSSSIIVDSDSGERTIFSGHNASEKFEVSSEKIERPHWIFTGDLSGDWQKSLETIIAAARQKHILIALNPRQKLINANVTKVIEAISKCELLFVNKDEAMEIVSGCGDFPVRELLENEEYLLKVLFRLGAKNVAMTDGVRGAWGYDGFKILHANAIIQKAVDTTGAGDAFTSGFFAAHLKRYELETCLKWGIANSSSSVTQYGGQKGLLSEEEMQLLSAKVQIEKC